jgi:hypothetical protein
LKQVGHLHPRARSPAQPVIGIAENDIAATTVQRGFSLDRKQYFATESTSKSHQAGNIGITETSGKPDADFNATAQQMGLSRAGFTTAKFRFGDNGVFLWRRKLPVSATKETSHAGKLD